eukprot:CAMPEP_0196584072 /NCGR_PEP_ID=MMETSP1081-20130531/45704_1 /TAXON_ID=36882 /ORGANISM="Pyramimonas amylifera, Strain CCMP720" /LENGTH=191 /DNA_ID=CAMNT_0041905159 /DNA_START=74 /DNA_END=649 /DNA_ORIENTATION=-
MKEKSTTVIKTKKVSLNNEVILSSTAIPLLYELAARGPKGFLNPAADFFLGLGLPEPLVHWGHPAAMAVVLLAVGGYGSYLGWQIRVGEDGELVAKATDLHPLLMVFMTANFTIGATGGLLSLVMQGQPAFSTSHFATGITGLILLYLQGMLSLFFEDDPNARTAHAYFGSAIMALFVIHMFVGIKLGLSI